jgi:prepilin-type N-terminal cleavage/methylation domain-containing protein
MPMLKMLNSRESGFSLIELMLVIAIAGILANIMVISLGSMMMKARDAKRKADLQALRVAVQQHYIDNGTYAIPGTGSNSTGNGGNINQGYGAVVSGTLPYPGTPISVKLKEEGYLQKAPFCDPADSPPCFMNYLVNYYYSVCEGGTAYSLSTTLERPNAYDLSHVVTACGATQGQPNDTNGWIPIDDPIKAKNYAVP